MFSASILELIGVLRSVFYQVGPTFWLVLAVFTNAMWPYIKLGVGLPTESVLCIYYVNPLGSSFLHERSN